MLPFVADQRFSVHWKSFRVCMKIAPKHRRALTRKLLTDTQCLLVGLKQ
jgi:hypothetical protein